MKSEGFRAAQPRASLIRYYVSEINESIGREMMIRPILVMLVFGCLLAACATEECSKGEQAEPKTHKSDMTHVITYDTHYYMSGPQQARPPEGMFKAGTKVELIQDAGSYSLVRSQDGIEAYVSTDALKVLQ